MSHTPSGPPEISPRRLWYVTIGVIAVAAIVVTYGMIFAPQNAARARQRACIQAHSGSVDTVTDGVALKRIVSECKARYPG
jgi:hypothetical protein